MHYLKAGNKQTEITRIIKIHKSTLSRELRRNRGLRDYRPKQAYQFALNRRKKTRFRIAENTWEWIEILIRQEWSPEKILAWLRENFGIPISHEWIYHYFLNDNQAGGDLHRHLRCQKKRRKLYGNCDRRGKLKTQGEHRRTACSCGYTPTSERIVKTRLDAIQFVVRSKWRYYPIKFE